MEVRKGYKQTEIGTIPNDWEVVSLGDRFSFSGGYSASRDQLSADGFCYLHYGDIHKSKRTFIDVKSEYVDIPKLNIPIRAVQTKSLLEDGDVVFVDASEDDEGASRHLVVRNPECIPYISGLHTIVSKSKDESLNKNYRQYCFQTYDVKRQFKYFAVGTKVTGISKSNIAKILIPLPSTIAEQEIIATALSDTDSLITSLEILIAKKHSIKQGAMQELLTGKKRLPGFSGKWGVKRLGDCLLRRPEYGINAAAIEYSDILPTYLRITDISDDGKIKLKEKSSVNHLSSDQYYLQENDIVLARTGASVGKNYLYNSKDGKLVFAGFLIRIKVNPNILHHRFLKGVLETKYYWNWVSVMSMRSGQPGINGNEYSQFIINVPSLPEQTAIAQVLGDMDAEIESLERKLEKFKLLKQGMMQELLTGKTRLV